MSDNPEKVPRRRLSSILKNVGDNPRDSPTETFARISKRISFSRINNVKEFAADVNNGTTIWGESYEKTESVATSSGQDTAYSQNITHAPTHGISLFADIQEEAMDIEMEKPHLLRESVIQGGLTENLNQTIYGNQTMACDISEAGNSFDGAHKRKSAQNISMEESFVQSSSGKIRKINGRQLDLTLLQHITMDTRDDQQHCLSDRNVDLNVTRMYNVDVSISDELTVDTTSNKTSTTNTTMCIDNQSMTSSISHISKPNINKTHIYGSDNVSARIDQTLLTGNRLEDCNFSQFAIANDQSELETETTISSLNKSQDLDIVDESPASWSISADTDEREEFTISAKVNLTFHDMSSNADELQSSIFFDDNLPMEAKVCDNLQVLEMRRRDEEQRSPCFRHIESGIDDFYVREKKYTGMDSSDLLEKRRREEDRRSPSFRHIESGIDEFYVKEKKVPGMDSLDVMEKRRREEDRRSPTFYSIESGIDDFYVRENVREKKDPGINSLDVLEKRRREEDRRSPTFYNIEDNSTSRVKTSSAESSQIVIGNIQKNTAILQDHQLLAIDDLSFTIADPLSSTKVVRVSSVTKIDPNTDTKPSQSCLTFNYCPTPMLTKSRDFRSGMSSQNNTDELCNLEPEQLRRRTMKKLFLDMTNEMLSETKYESINESTVEEGAVDGTDISAVESHMEELAVNKMQCQKCINCRRSDQSFLKIDDLKELKLDFSVYDQFKGFATFHHVIEARKKRLAARELEKQLLMNQNVEAPDFEFLWKNMLETTKVPNPPYIPEPIICFPMLMTIEYLMKNKMTTEYTKWKYYDNYFFIGAVALRHEKVPSIRIHIKFGGEGPKKAHKLNMPILFERVFVEECPFYLKNVSARTYLKHKHALAMLPIDLTTICSDSQNIYKALDQFDEWFESAVAKVNEVIQLTIECEAFLKIDEKQCYIEQTVFDIKKYISQEYVIKLDKIDSVGPRNVFFEPACETTDEFKNLPVGFPFLRAFLSNPKSFLRPFLPS